MSILRILSPAILIFFISFQSFPQDIIYTPYELSGKKNTATYEQGIDFYNKLDEKYNTIKTIEAGQTDQGIPLHLVIYNSDKEFDIELLNSSNKIKILVMNAIHPGEPAGVDASMMLLRDIAAKKQLEEISNQFVLIIIPFYNIGGALNRNSFSRANQNGPGEYGFRGNAKNLDLNRDFIKSDSENARSFAKIFHQFDPELFIDTHTSNGADYRYTITYLETHPEKLGGQLGMFLRGHFSPALSKLMSEKNCEMFPFVNVYLNTPDKGFSQFFDGPRYSTGYTTLFQTIGFMSEAHMLKPFSDRVECTREFLISMVQAGVNYKDEIKKRRIEDRQKLKDQLDFVIDWDTNDDKVDFLIFKGYQPIYKQSNVTQQPRLVYDHNNPITVEIPYYNGLQPKNSVRRPKAYLIPQEWNDVIDILEINSIEFSRIQKDTAINVTIYFIQDMNTYNNPHEGHYPHFNTNVITEADLIAFHKGDIIIYTDQPGIRYLLETLEPEAPDSFFNWNFFDSILSQKEHFSSYVFEETAEQILQGHPSLRDSLIQKRNSDDTFNSDARAQLNYIYKNSPYFEKSFKRYPVFRIE